MTDPNPAPPPAGTPADPSLTPTPPNPAAPAAPPTGDPAAPAAPAAVSWPEDWRKQMVGEDDKELKQAERYASPKDIWKKARELERRLSSGELLKPLPDNATPEQIAEFRQVRGIPDKPEAYLEKLPNGLVIGEDDKPIFESLAKSLHDRNADPKIAHGIVEWYNNFKEEVQAEQAEADTAHKTEVEDALRNEWGADYRANVNHVRTYLSSLPEGVADRIASARDADGRAILNDPAVMRWMAQTARELNPTHTIVPGTDGNHGKTIDAEIAEQEKFMREHRSEYNRDEKRQARLRDLYGAREKLKSRVA